MEEYATTALGLHFVKNLAYLTRRFDRVRVFVLGGDAGGDYWDYEPWKAEYLQAKERWWVFVWNGRSDASGHFDATRECE